MRMFYQNIHNRPFFYGELIEPIGIRAKDERVCGVCVKELTKLPLLESGGVVAECVLEKNTLEA